MSVKEDVMNINKDSAKEDMAEGKEVEVKKME